MKEPKRYYCGIGEGMFEDDTNGHWIEYSEHKAIVEELNQALRIHDVVGRSEQFTCSCGIPPAIRLCEGVESCLKCGKKLSK
jgi:hypothetical protein